MLIIKKVTVNEDWGTREVEFLNFENLQEMEKSFHVSYIHELLKTGYFKIRYTTIGHPLDRDTWNGYVTYFNVS